MIPIETDEARNTPLGVPDGAPGSTMNDNNLYVSKTQQPTHEEKFVEAIFKLIDAHCHCHTGTIPIEYRVKICDEAKAELLRVVKNETGSEWVAFPVIHFIKKEQKEIDG